jgi:hypothetical protein
VKKISDAERTMAMAKLGALWSQLGFEYFKNKVWTLDLAMRDFADRMEMIRHRVGLL